MKSRQDAKKLPIEDQRKQINGAPLTVEYIRYSMNTLLADCSAAEKGRFILRTMSRINPAVNIALKRCVQMRPPFFRTGKERSLLKIKLVNNMSMESTIWKKHHDSAIK